jgi:hypothetical protein
VIIFNVKLLCKKNTIFGGWAEKIYRITAKDSGAALRQACELAKFDNLTPDSGRAVVDPVRQASAAEMARAK